MPFNFKKKDQTSASEEEEKTVPGTPSPKRSRQFKPEEGDEVNSDSEDQTKSSVKKNKSSRKVKAEAKTSEKAEAKSKGGGGCCTCKRLLCSSICLILSTVIGIVVWRYGPWAKDSASSDVQSLQAESTDTCDDVACCNGLASNCDLPVNEVLFPMVHNAHSSYDNNFVGASNSKPFEEALVAGYRALQLSTCMCESFISKLLLEQDEEWGLGDSNLGFCHTACGAGVRDPKDVLTNLKTFIETNTQEILIIEFDMNDGSSNDLRTALQYSGLLDYVYHPQDEYYIEEWPTMQQMIDDDKRIILFGSGDGMKSCPAYDCDDGILYTNDHFSHTATDGSDLDACKATAALSEDVIEEGYFRMNHYEKNAVKMPSPSKARELNSYIVLEKRFEACQEGLQLQPNLLAVEFWDEGQVLEFVKNENVGKNRVGGEYSLVVPEEEEEDEREETGGSRHGLRG